MTAPSSSRIVSPVGPIGLAALAVGLAVLFGIVGASVWLSAKNRTALEIVDRERSRYLLTRSVPEIVTQAETGQRGFLLTGKDSYLVPHDEAVTKLEAALEQLESQTNGDADRRIAETLHAAVSEKLTELRATIDLAKRGDRDAALALVQTDRGQRAMDMIQTITGEVSQAEQALIARQFASINERGRVAVRVAGAGLAGVVLLAVFLAWGLRRYLAVLRAAQTELEAANHLLANSNEVLERAVANRTADLVEANEEIQRFAYIVSHDLRSPLVNIMGFTSELQTATDTLARYASEAAERAAEAMPREVSEAASDDIPEAIRFIKASTAKMDLLIGAILRLSREGRRVLTPEPLDMNAVIGQIVDTLQHQIANRETEMTIGALPALTADRVAIEQIFGNLLDNALKYLQPGRQGHVTVEARIDGRAAVFDVRDNGRGIADKDRGRIFELFRRAGDQTVAGEGIGLAHVRALVRRIGGSIACESVLGEGTTFRVRLPMAASPARSEPA